VGNCGAEPCQSGQHFSCLGTRSRCALLFVRSFCATPPHLNFPKGRRVRLLEFKLHLSRRCRMTVLRSRRGAEWPKISGGYWWISWACGWRWPHVCAWLAGDRHENRALEADICDSSYRRLHQLKGQQNSGKLSSRTHVSLAWYPIAWTPRYGWPHASPVPP
jgi:hypothetical protein